MVHSRTSGRRLGSSLALAYGIALLAIIASGFSAFVNSRAQDHAAGVVIRTHQVLAALTDIETSMTDAETGQRGYLLTGEEAFLEPYLAATGTGRVPVISRLPVDRLLASLGTTLPNPTEKILIAQIAQLVHAKFAELAQTIALRRAGHTEAAVAIVREGRGKRVMDQLRATLSSMRAEQRRQLEASEKVRVGESREALLSSALTCVLSLLTIVLLWVTSRAAQARLRKQHDEFQMLADHISQHAWTLSPSGQFVWFNRRWCEYTGCEPGGDPDAQWQQAASHPIHRDRVASGLRHAVAAGQPWEDIFPLRAADGSWQWFLVRAMPIRGPGGKVLRWFGTNTNIDDRLRLEQQLQDANRRKDEFIATLAHELRNPLAPIQAGIELMKLNPAFPPPLERTRAIMHRQLGHLVRLIDDLLDVSRISAGKLELQMEVVSVKTVIESALETSRMHIESSGHALEVAIPAEPLLVRGDLVRLAQVVGNLLNNGAKYTPDGGRVTVTAGREGEEAVVRVSDTGIGIDREMLPLIFDLFSQAPDARARRKGGIGIGLSIARQLVQMHGGTLVADSPGLGRGSTFTVRLPLVKAVQTPDTPALPARGAAPADPRRILILDDNVDAAHTLAALLRLAGHEIALAHTGHEAVELAATFRPDIAFLDIGLPDMTGYDVARAFRAQAPLHAVRLVALTGWGAPRDRDESKEAGFDHHLTKPVSLAAIAEVLPELSLPAARDQAPGMPS